MERDRVGMRVIVGGREKTLRRAREGVMVALLGVEGRECE